MRRIAFGLAMAVCSVSVAGGNCGYYGSYSGSNAAAGWAGLAVGLGVGVILGNGGRCHDHYQVTNNYYYADRPAYTCAPATGYVPDCGQHLVQTDTRVVYVTPSPSDPCYVRGPEPLPIYKVNYYERAQRPYVTPPVNHPDYDNYNRNWGNPRGMAR
jgi:hypothetical protein